MDDDGIGDTPYLIPGPAGSVDLYPIWDDGPSAPDDVPPTTTIDISGTLGTNNWYTSFLSIKFYATDEESGVNFTEYSFDEINWETYIDTVLINTEGIYSIFYRSVDNVGNVELSKLNTIQIDLDAPSTEIKLDGILGSNGWYISNLNIALFATDDISGINRIEYSINGINWITYLDSFNIISEGITTIYYRAIDNAGNKGILLMKTVKIDYTNPLTAISLDGIFSYKDWYDTNVAFTLSATDDVSGVSVSEYSLDSINWLTYTGSFNISTSGIITIYYRSTDFASNSEIIKSATIKVIGAPFIIEEHLDIIINILENLDLPEEADHFIEKAILFLIQARDKFESGMLYEGFDKIRDSMEFLIMAGEMGANIQEVIDYIIVLVKSVVNHAIEETIDIVGEFNRFIIRAIEYYDTALIMLVSENYDEAVRFFKQSYKNTMKARDDLIIESYCDDLLDLIEKIQELKAGSIPQEALNYLDQAENKLLLAIDKANNSMLAQSLIQLKDVVKNLLDTEQFGVDTTDIIQAILQNTDDVTYLKILEAESILMGEGNRHIDKAWINYYKAIDLWNEGKSEFALGYYAKAIEKVNDALA
ncbi:hypothetical protein ES705_30227 [subsurface metagenome]